MAIALIGTALHSTATAQTVSASDFPTIAPATNGAARASDDVCEQRLLKALDALEKAEKALGAARSEIDARKKLDSLKDQWIAVKDLIIQEQDKLIKLLQSQKKGNSIWSRIKRVLEIAEKVALIGIGVWVGRGL